MRRRDRLRHGGAIRLCEISKRFGVVQALADVSCDIAEGEFFCVLGPPGAGKTTLLRTIVGLERPDRGIVYLGDMDVTDVEPSRRNVGIVFQNLALYPDKTVYDNLAFPLRQQKIDREEIDRRVRDAAALLHITELLGRTPGTLSGGERQRVAIGRAITPRPIIYLLDEPLSALDALLRLEMRAELKRLQRELGRTVVYVTHDQIEALSMADRICVLKDGRVQQIDDAKTVYRRPANTFVARTVGSPPINLIAVRSEFADHAVELRHGAFHVSHRLDGDLGFRVPRDPGVILGVRPEDVKIGADAVSPVAICEVIAVEPLGGETIVDLDLAGQILKAQLGPTTEVRSGDRVPVQFDLRRSHLFESDGTTLLS